MSKTNNINKTLQDNLCIDCGICDVSCPHDAIEMHFDENKNFRPKVFDDKCTDCGICYAVCPMSSKNLNNRIKDASRDGLSYGLNNTKGIFKGYEEKYSDYIQSASGGVLSALLKHLIETKVIDTVIHAEQLLGDDKNPYFKSSISHSSEEIDAKRSSFYYPINFSPTLKNAMDNDKMQSIVVLGTPCVLSGIKQLRKYNKALDKKIRFTFSLTCSHNVSGQFTDCLVKNINPNTSDKFKFKHRDKLDIKKDSEFNNSLKNDSKYIRKNRNNTCFTNNWRSYSYAHEGCLYCPDFFGADADAGFKDAWGFSIDRKEGETVFFVNSEELISSLSEMKKEKKVSYSSVSKSALIKSQKDTLLLKTYFAPLKQKKHSKLNSTKPKQENIRYSILEKLLINLDHWIKKSNSRKSKKEFLKASKPLSKRRLKWSAFLTRKIGVYLNILSIPRENQAKFEVLYTAGFGYDNIGDEAQLSSNLELWNDFYPEAKLTILSPNIDYTRKVHGNYDILPASRKTFWGMHNVEYGGLSERKIFKIFFQYRFVNLKIAAFFLKYFNRTIFLSPQSSYLLKRIQKANLLHIGGGGYLTGKTQSRLFDNMGLIWAANYFKLDVILSGHNIGIWQNSYQKKIAKQLKKAAFIGLRDNEASIKDLKSIGISDTKKVFPLFDDALFCSNATEDELAQFFVKNNLKREDKYILINAYFFKNTEKLVKSTIENLAKIIDRKFQNKGYQIILLSMHDTDIAALEFFKKSLKTESHIFSHNNNFKIVISLVRNSNFMISMRHHPIIFAMSGGVPTISIVFDDYFKHKNIGAMKLFEQENYVCREDEVVNGLFEKKLSTLIENREEISSIISKHAFEYKKKRGLIIKKYLKEFLNIKVSNSK